MSNREIYDLRHTTTRHEIPENNHVWHEYMIEGFRGNTRIFSFNPEIKISTSNWSYLYDATMWDANYICKLHGDAFIEIRGDKAIFGMRYGRCSIEVEMPASACLREFRRMSRGDESEHDNL